MCVLYPEETVQNFSACEPANHQEPTVEIYTLEHDSKAINNSIIVNRSKQGENSHVISLEST